MTSYNMTDFFPFTTQLVLGITSHVYRTSSMVALRGVTRTLKLGGVDCEQGGESLEG